MKIKFGWKKDKFDKRDYKHRAIPVLEIPDVTILDQVPTVRNQGSQGSCVGHGVGGVLTGTIMKLEMFTEWFGPRWIYNGARFLEGTIKEDSGAYPRDAYEWLRTKGCLLEHFWPYTDHTDLTMPPPSQYDLEAAKFPIITYYRVVDGVDNICSAISLGNYVSIGCPWYSSWMDVPDTGLLPNITSHSSISGGHETYLYGYDRNKKIFYGSNSWGEDWGNKGRYLMPFQAFNHFKHGGGYDVHYVEVDWVKKSSSSSFSKTDTGTGEKKARIQEYINGNWITFIEWNIT